MDGESDGGGVGRAVLVEKRRGPRVPWRLGPTPGAGDQQVRQSSLRTHSGFRHSAGNSAADLPGWDGVMGSQGKAGKG